MRHESLFSPVHIPVCINSKVLWFSSFVLPLHLMRQNTYHHVLLSIITNSIVPEMLWFTILLILVAENPKDISLSLNACCSVLNVVMFICFFLFLFVFCARVSLISLMLYSDWDVSFTILWFVRMNFIFLCLISRFHWFYVKVPWFIKQDYLSLWDLRLSRLVFAKLEAFIALKVHIYDSL